MLSGERRSSVVHLDREGVSEVQLPTYTTTSLGFGPGSEYTWRGLGGDLKNVYACT